jgi:hypothetical protein
MFSKMIVLASLVLSFQAFAAKIESSKNDVNVARVVEIVKLVNKSDIQVNLVVVDNGGSTDMSPTQSLFFNIYSKGEMFSTDASFDLGYIFSLVSAKRVTNGVYEVKYMNIDDNSGNFVEMTKIIDASEAIIALKNVTCEDFDCEASTSFKASIEVENK